MDGLSRLEPLVGRAKQLGMHSLGITDHGGMYGAIDFYRLSQKAEIKPIIGCEMYVAPASRLAKTRDDKSPYHMTVLAKDATGYGNLVKLVSKSHLEGFYYKPRIDRELLEKYHEGLIVLSGCPSGEVPGNITQGYLDEAKKTASWYKELLGDRYFLEFMEHGDVPELPAINQGLMSIHKELEIPIVATNDLHYIDKEDAPLQDILICIHTNTNIQDERRLRMSENSYYLKTHDEMAALYPELPDAITNTELIAEMCNLELDFTKLRLPQYQIPDGLAADDYLEKICWEGLRRRIENITDAEKERLTYELDVIKYTQFANYFLVVWDIARFVRERDIFFAVRGSAAASLVLFCLGVTNVNPLPFKLVFERFLNVERKEMPDIDMDFQDDRREEVINYVVEKYGREHVAQIITFGTLGAKASVRDVGRALALPYSEADRVARLIPFKLHITLDDAIDMNPELKEIYEADDAIHNLVDIAKGLEGLTRHSSTHAAGVVISAEPLDDVVPLQKPIRGDENFVAMTQYTMEPCAALGLLKMDFLGLVNLSILARARDLIASNWGVNLSLVDIPLDDQNTFDLLSRGDTVGVFQLEGAGMTRYIKELKPTTLSDVAAMIALYRPGPMEHISTFIDGKHGRAEPHYPHPALKDILEETYGVIVYQDQVLHIARTFAGYSLGEADIVRKSMGKKIAEIMAQERDKFIDGAVNQGYTKALAEQVFALIEPFAGYAFNKAHSVSYGLISYWTAYLKANYPAEYMVSLLNAYMDNTEKISTAIAECRRLDITALPPDINLGEAEFSIESDTDGKQAIRFGMAAVKNVGASAVQPVIDSRKKNGPFTSLEQMCKEADFSALNRKTLESLIRAGALDSFGSRGAINSAVEKILALAQSEARLRDSNQTSMFELMTESSSASIATITLPDIDTPDSELSAWESELLGVSITSGNVLQSIVSNLDPDTIVFCSQIEPEMARRKVTVIGQVSSVTQRFTRENKPFSIVNLNLIDGPLEIFVWDNVAQETDGLWIEGKLVTVIGTVRVRDDQISISCSQASEYVLVDSEGSEPVPDAPDEEFVDTGYSTNGTNGKNGVNGSGIPQIAPSTAPTGSGSPAVTEIVPHRQATSTQTMGRKVLNLRIQETHNADSDRYMLEDLKFALLEYQGQDDINLEIVTSGRVVVLEWPVKVDARPELQEQLQAILGSSGTVSIQSAMF